MRCLNLIWDAVNDPLMGIIIENCHLKSGKFRPWILMGVILNSIVIVLLFSVRPKGWWFVLFFGLAYLAWSMTYTMNDIAYWGMLPSLSSDPKERNSLVTWMSIFICIGQFSVAGVLPTVVAGNAVNAYRVAAFIIAGCFIGFQLLTFFGVKEQPRKDLEEKLTLKSMFKIFARNDQLIAGGVASFLFNIGNGILIVFAVNFFYFEFGYKEGGNLIFLFTVMYGLGTLVSQAMYEFLASRFKRMQLLCGCIVLIFVGYLGLLSIGYILPKNTVLLNAIGFLIFFAQGLYNLVVVVMLNNTIEYDEARFHERHDSVISAVRSFSVKLAGAVNQGICALILIISGIYGISQRISDLEIKVGTGSMESGEARNLADTFVATVTQEQTLILRCGMVLVPVATILASYILLRKKYIIDENKYLELINKEK